MHRPAWRGRGAELWRRATEPHPAVVRPEERRAARLLGGLLVPLILLGLLALAASACLVPGEERATSSASLAGLAAVLVLVVAYAFSRTRRHVYGAILAVAASQAGTWLVALEGSATPTGAFSLAFLVIPILLSVLLLPAAATAVLLVLDVAGLVLAGRLTPQWDSVLVSSAVVFLAMASALILVFALLRARDLDHIAEQSRRLRESEERFELAIRGANDGIWDWNVEADDLYVSPRGRELLGLPDGGAPLSMSAWEARLAPAARAAFRAALARHLGEGRVIERELEVDGAHGPRWVLVRGASPPPGDGGRRRVAGSITDVSGRKADEARLVEVKDLLEDIVENVPAGVLHFDADGRITFENQFLLRALGSAGVERPRSWGSRVFDHPTTRHNPALADGVRGMLAGVPFHDVEASHAATGSAEATFSVSGVPVLRGGRDGGPRTVAAGILLFRDVTAERAAAREVEASRRHVAMSEKLSALGTLVAGVAHEINNPLAFIKGSAELTGMCVAEAREVPGVPPEIASLLEEIAEHERIMEEGIDRIAHITTSLKEVARASNGARSPTDVNGVVESVLTVAGPRLKSVARVEQRLEARSPSQANASEISQVILNLVLNAAEALDGCDEGTVEIATRDDKDRVVIEVRDSGPGIREQDKARIFLPFFTTKPRGTGLGLSVSYRIVEDHGGRLTFDSAPGRGTTFRVELPLAPG